MHMLYLWHIYHKEGDIMATKKSVSVKKTTAKKAVTKRPATRANSKAAITGIGGHITASLQSVKLWKSLGAEFIGTFLLASIFIVGQGQPIFILFGMAGIVLMLGAISGAYVNPALTVAAWVTRRMGWLRTVAYIVAQLLGGIVSFFTLKTFLAGAPSPDAEAISFGANAPELFSALPLVNIEGKEWYVFFAEVLGTAILAFAFAYALRALRAKDTIGAAFSAGFGIFIALMIGITVAGYVSASSILNPAVAISLQAFDASFWSYAMYALGPIVGAVVGFGLYDLLKNEKA